MLRSILSTSAVILLAATASFAATFNVNTTNDTQDVNPGDGICSDAAGDCSFRAAITEANALKGDDVINVPAGIFTQSLVAADEDNNAGGDWDIRSNITINGAGAIRTIFQAAELSGAATERVLNVVLSTNVVKINGVTLRHGNKTGSASNDTRGGGIRNVGILTLSFCIITENISPGGGGIHNERSITLDNVAVIDNSCINAVASCFGGGMYNALSADVDIWIFNSQFIGNTASTTAADSFGFAAGFGIEGASGFFLYAENSTFVDNTGVGTGTGGSNGSGIRILATAESSAVLNDIVVSGNQGTGGSAIQGSGIQGFTSGIGSFVFTMNRSTISGNTANESSGMSFDAGGGPLDVHIINSTISGNEATANGGGLGLSSSAGVRVTANIGNSTLSGNTAGQNGGGIAVVRTAPTGTVTGNINYSTIVNNIANGDNVGSEGGGGFFVSPLGAVTLANSVVANNSVGTGGTGPDILGTVTSQDYNHIRDLSGAIITGTAANNTKGDPLLGPLADNGGPTLTHLPLPGSPLINAIPRFVNQCGSPVNIDQRGFDRPSHFLYDIICDKGSVEVAVAAVTVSGRLLTPGGRPIANAVVKIQGPLENRTTTTGHFGTYYFDNVRTGHTYTLSVVDGKRYSFSPSSREIQVDSEVTDENFISDNNMFTKGL